MKKQEKKFQMKKARNIMLKKDIETAPEL